MSQEQLNHINKAIKDASDALGKFGNDKYDYLGEIERLKAAKSKLPPNILRQEAIDNLKQPFYLAIKQNFKYPSTDSQLAVDKLTKELQDLNFPEDGFRKITAKAEIDSIDELQKNTLSKLKKELQKYIASTRQSTDTLRHIHVQKEVVDKVSSDISQVFIDIIQRAIELKVELSTIQTLIDAELILTEDMKKVKLNQLTSDVRDYISNLNFKAFIDSSTIVPNDMIQVIEEWESEKPIELDRSPEHKILRAKRDLEIYGVSQEEIHIAIRIGQYTASES